MITVDQFIYEIFLNEFEEPVSIKQNKKDFFYLFLEYEKKCSTGSKPEIFCIERDDMCVLMKMAKELFSFIKENKNLIDVIENMRRISEENSKSMSYLYKIDPDNIYLDEHKNLLYLEINRRYFSPEHLRLTYHIDENKITLAFYLYPDSPRYMNGEDVFVLLKIDLLDYSISTDEKLYGTVKNIFDVEPSVPYKTLGLDYQFNFDKGCYECGERTELFAIAPYYVLEKALSKFNQLKSLINITKAEKALLHEMINDFFLDSKEEFQKLGVCADVKTLSLWISIESETEDSYLILSVEENKRNKYSISLNFFTSVYSKCDCSSESVYSSTIDYELLKTSV